MIRSFPVRGPFILSNAFINLQVLASNAISFCPINLSSKKVGTSLKILECRFHQITTKFSKLSLRCLKLRGKPTYRRKGIIKMDIIFIIINMTKSGLPSTEKPWKTVYLLRSAYLDKYLCLPVVHYTIIIINRKIFIIPLEPFGA